MSIHFEAWKTSDVNGTSRTARMRSLHCGPALRPGFKSSEGGDSNNFQNCQMENNLENTRKRSQEDLIVDTCHKDKILKKYLYLCVTLINSYTRKMWTQYRTNTQCEWTHLLPCVGICLIVPIGFLVKKTHLQFKGYVIDRRKTGAHAHKHSSMLAYITIIKRGVRAVPADYTTRFMYTLP